MTARLRHGAFISAQKGQALLIALIIAGMAGSALVYRLSASAVSLRQEDMRTTTALAQARDALIGSAAAENNRPGALPCPDADNDGDADGPIGYPGSNCKTYTGRLPWRTLGLPDIRDGSGERLWYVLSPVFRDYQNAGALNPDTAGQFTVQNDAGAVLDNSAVAVIIAPGAVIGTQTRTPGTADEGNVAMYLEGENANGDTTYSAALPSATFNDRVAYITREALFSHVVLRVAKEVRSALENYRATNHYYPSASPYTAGPPNYDCVPGELRGYVPLKIESSGACSDNWANGRINGVLKQPQLPTWFADNNWDLFTHYAVASTCTMSDPASQLACDADAGASPLTVMGVTTKARMLVIVSGTTRNGLTCSSSAQCLEDSANSDGNNPYVKPSRFPASNDHMAVTCSNATPCAVVP